MAAIPNRYYNSPWIAEAGANLASALAPPDPEKTLAAQRNKWQFDRAQEVARMQDEELAQKDIRQQALGDILTTHGLPEEGTGYPNKAADDAALDAAMQKAIKEGVPINDVMLAGGTRSRKYLQQQALADDKYASQAANSDARLAQAMEIFLRGETGKNARADDLIQLRRDLAADNDKLRRDLTTQTETGKTARDANGSGGGTPLDQSWSDDVNLGYAVDDYAEKLGVKLPQDVHRAFKERAAQIYQRTRNSTTALEQAGREFFGETPVVNPARDPWGWGDEEDYPATVNLRGGKSLSAIMMELARLQQPGAGAAPVAAPPQAGPSLPGTGQLIPGAAPPAATQPQQQGGPKEGQRALSKKGRPMIYVNGQWELELK